MDIAIYETYDNHTKTWFWWTGRDRATNCFEIRKSSDKYNLIVNDVLNAKNLDFNDAMGKLKTMYDSGSDNKSFRVLRR